MYQLSPVGQQFIKNEEALRLSAYFCPAGKLTIGYGHRLAGGVTSATMHITEQIADDWFAEDTAVILKELWAECTFLNPHQVDALVSFIYNIGIGAWRGSTARHDVLQHLDAFVPSQMKLWIHDDHGNVIPGLVNRRDREVKMYEGLV